MAGIDFARLAGRRILLPGKVAPVPAEAEIHFHSPLPKWLDPPRRILPVFLQHPLLRPDTVEDRGFQRVLSEKILQGPLLVVLPTGLGKTVIALRAMVSHLERAPDRRVLVLAPTKPLADQHARFFGQALVGVPVISLTGETGPADRDLEWRSARVVVATPQVIQNDLVRGARDLSDVSFLVFDEAHRASGAYPYAFIASRYAAAGGTAAVGLTASPGNDPGAVNRILRALRLARVEVRSDHDPDVAPHVHAVATDWVRVRPTPAEERVRRLLSRMAARCILSLRAFGHFTTLRRIPTRKDLLQLGQRLRVDGARGSNRGTYEGMSLQARALKIHHALELAETQGCAAAARFLERLQVEAESVGGSKAARDLVREPEFAEALSQARQETGTSPKAVRVAELLRAQLAAGCRRALVFANFRETADALVEILATVPGVRVHRFVGHGTSGGERGLTKREQQEVVERFRTGDLNVLVATAVGEEGLDLPETDVVVLHEPVPSVIRLVQRRGRTGRRGEGRLFVLISEGTRDEAYYWSAARRERSLAGNLAILKHMTPPAAPVPPPGPAPPAVPLKPLDRTEEITMDPRESQSQVARSLLERGIRVKVTPLPTGDFEIGGRILVERKTAEDLAASVKDGRLFDQLGRMQGAPARVLLVEGSPFEGAGGLSRSALAGALASAAVDFGVSVLQAPDGEVGAEILASLARRLRQNGSTPPLRLEKAPRSPEAQLRFVLEGVPLVGPVTARSLLVRFGSIAELCQAPADELENVEGVGPERARALHELLHRRYAENASSAVSGKVEAPVAALEGGNGPAR